MNQFFFGKIAYFIAIKRGVFFSKKQVFSGNSGKVVIEIFLI